MTGSIFNDKLIAKLKQIKDIPDDCLTTIERLFSLIEDSFEVDFQGVDLSNNIVISTDTPSPDDISKVWLKIDADRTLRGYYLFSNGSWVRQNDAYLGEIRFFVKGAELPKNFKAIKEVKYSEFVGTDVSGDQQVKETDTIVMALKNS